MRGWAVLLVLLASCATSATQAAQMQVHARATYLAPNRDPQLQAVRALTKMREKDIDLAYVTLTIDRVMDPAANDTATLAEVDTLVHDIRGRFRSNASAQEKLTILISSLAQPGPWNSYRAFSYDMADPYGNNIKNKLLRSYLSTRKGNCVSMPVLLVILGQKLGLEMTLATAPEHLLAKSRAGAGPWVNVEATSFGFKRDSSYVQELGITRLAVSNAVYLQPLSKRESIGALLGTLMEFYGDLGKQTHRMAVADMALQLNPKDIVAMLHKGNAYYRLMKSMYLDVYPSQQAIPRAKQAEFAALARGNRIWFQKAEALGWVQPPPQAATR